jgi:hypothetical protein
VGSILWKVECVHGNCEALWVERRGCKVVYCKEKTAYITCGTGL